MLSMFLSGVVLTAQTIEFKSGSTLHYKGSLGYSFSWFPFDDSETFRPEYLNSYKGVLDLTYQFSDVPVELKFTPRFYIDLNDKTLQAKGLFGIGEGRNRLVFDDLYFDFIQDSYEIRGGYQIYSWKTVEGYSWVDFLNQTDQQIDLMDPDKVSELSLRTRIVLPTETEQYFEIYYLPWFTPANFPQKGSRFAVGDGALSNKHDDVTYGSTDERWRPQYALRYLSTFMDEIDYTLFFYHGYERGVIAKASYNSVGDFIGVHPHYEPVYKTGGTFQGVIDEWLIKGELLYRRYENRTLKTVLNEPVDDLWATTIGTEYTLYSPIIKNHDVGVIAEAVVSSDLNKNFDELETFRPFNNHWFAGARYTFNNKSDRAILIGNFSNLLKYENTVTFEYSERFLESLSMKLSVMTLVGEEDSDLSSLDYLSNLSADVTYNF